MTYTSNPAQFAGIDEGGPVTPTVNQLPHWGESGASPPHMSAVEKSLPGGATTRSVPFAEPPYITLAEAAALIAVDERTLRRWASSDASLPVLRRGRVVRLHRARFLDWCGRQEPRSARRIAQAQRKAPECVV
jgi:excisionase family DNA binding protein